MPKKSVRPFLSIMKADTGSIVLMVLFTSKLFTMKTSANTFSQQLCWIKNFVESNNSSTTDWQQYNVVARQLGKSLDSISLLKKRKLANAFGSVMTTETLQGFAFTKPHGYAGDYEIIDKLYTHYTSPDKRFARWDEHMHSMSAAKAVCNRKTYIKQLLEEKMNTHQAESSFDMLNLASGPGRDLYEFFTENAEANISIDCIELDKKAIAYAAALLANFSDRVNFYNQNVLQLNCKKNYDLIWSAGLFDYFNDDIFMRLVRRFLNNVKPGGELVIGNFCTSNPDIDYMRLLNWNLYHRSAADLVILVMQCDVLPGNITIEKEPEGVNLFIRIKK